MRNCIIFLLSIISFNHAFASDEIICDSKSFNVSLAVGTDGSVVSMVLSDVSGLYFTKILEITNFSKDKRHVSMETKSVDVETKLDLNNASTFQICLANGAGYVRLGDYREMMTCDWEI